MSFNSPTARRRGSPQRIPLRFDPRIPGKKPTTFPANFNAPPRPAPALWPKPSWRPSPSVFRAVQRAGGILAIAGIVYDLAPPLPQPEQAFMPSKVTGPAPSGIEFANGKYNFEGYQITVLQSSGYQPSYVTYYQSSPFNTWPQVSQSPPSATNKMHLYPAPPTLVSSFPTVKTWRYFYYITVFPGVPTDPQFFPVNNPIWVPVPGPVPFFYPNPAAPGTRPEPVRTPRPRYRRVPSLRPRPLRGIQADLFPDGSVTLKPITSPGSRPRRPTIEKKMYARAAVALAKLLDGITEAVDFLGVLGEAAGIKSRRPADIFRELFVNGHISNFDYDRFAEAFLRNEIEDRIIGRASALKSKALRAGGQVRSTRLPSPSSF